MSKRTYEVAVEKLTKFAEVILKHKFFTLRRSIFLKAVTKYNGSFVVKKSTKNVIRFICCHVLVKSLFICID